MYSERSTFGVAVESAYGVWPTANKQLVNVRSARPTRNRSEEAPNVWAGDKRTHATEILEQSGALAVSSPLQYENGLIFHERLMGSARSAAISEGGTDVSATSNVLTSAAEADMDAFSLYDMVHLSGAGIAPNAAGWYGPVTAKTATTLTLAGPTITDFAAGAAVLIRTRRLIDGSTSGSLAWEIHMQALTNQFIRGSGFDVASIGWTWSQGSFAMEETALQGREWTHESATAASGIVAAPTSGFQNAVEPARGGVERLWIADGTAALAGGTSLIVNSWGVTWQQTLESILQVGSAGPGAIDQGGIDGSNVNANVRWDDNARTAVADLIQAHTPMQMAIAARDKAGASMCWFQPAGKPSGDIELGDRGAVVYHPLTVTSFDPAKNDESIYYNAGAGTGYQHAIFYVPAL